jgi:hypothetical protein
MQAGVKDKADGKMLILPYSANLGMLLNVCGLLGGSSWLVFRQRLCTRAFASHISFRQSLECF